MLRREQGWNLDSSRGDLWGWEKASQGRVYVVPIYTLNICQVPKYFSRNTDIYGRKRFINMISGDHQLEEPKQFFGGIIADHMGLGKTLTMIALVAATARHSPKHFRLQGIPDDVGNNNPTLIVVPPPYMFSFVAIRF